MVRPVLAGEAAAVAEEHIKRSPTLTTSSVLFRKRNVVVESVKIATFPLKLPLFSSFSVLEPEIPLVHTPSENGIRSPSLSKNLHRRHNGSVSGTLIVLSLATKIEFTCISGGHCAWARPEKRNYQ